MKKILLFVFIFSIILSPLSFSDDEIDNVDISNVTSIIQTASNITDEPKINSRAAIVLDRETKTVLYGKNEFEKKKMASTTKILTSLLVLENSNPEDIVTISFKAASMGGSRLGLKKGDKISVKDLLYGLMLRSGNDAAIAIAEFVSGNVDSFCELMNKKALELGLNNTHFESPHGLDSNNHYTTAYDLAILTNYALENEEFCKIVNTISYTIKINNYSKTINNTNELLGNLSGVYGVKTGFTNGAGRCLVTSVKRNNFDIICIVLGADTKKDRTFDSINLIEYTYINFKKINLQEKLEEEFINWNNINLNRININKGLNTGDLHLKLKEKGIKNYPVKIGCEDKIYFEIVANYNLKAPLEMASKIGEIKVMYDKNEIEKIDIITTDKIYKKNILDYIKELLCNF